MKSLGISPQEWAKRLGSGAAELAAAKGYAVVDAPGKAETRAPTKQINIDPKEKSWVLHHEAREAAKMEQYNKALQKGQQRIMKRIGVGARVSPGTTGGTGMLVRPITGFFEGIAKPELVEEMISGFREILQRPGFRSAQHASFSLPIRDIRESRLLSPETRKEINLLRRRTGELGDIVQAAKARGVEQALLPRHRINQLARKIEKLESARLDEMMKPSPTARRVGAFLRRLLKLK